MKKIAWILAAVVTLAIAALSIAQFNRSHQGRAGSQTGKPAPYHIRKLEIRSAKPVTQELLASLDPMTGVIAGRVEGTDPIEDLAVSYVDMRTGYQTLATMPITYEGRRFRAESLPAGTYRITKRDGYADRTLRLAPGEVVDDLVYGRNDVEVRLRLEGFSEPLPVGTRVSVHLRTLYDKTTSYSMNKSASLPKDRTLSLRMPRGRDMKAIVLTPQSGGVVKQGIPFSTAVDGVLEAPLRLEDWPKIAGKVVNAAGETVSGVTVTLLATYAPPRMQQESALRRAYRNVQITSGEDGEFAISVQPDRLAKLGFSDEMATLAEVDRVVPGRSPITVDIGGPRGSLQIQATHTPSGRPMGRINLILQRQNDREPVVRRTDSKGTATLRGLEAGQYDIQPPEGLTVTPNQVTVKAESQTQLVLTYKGPAPAAEESEPEASGIRLIEGRFEMVDKSELPTKAVIVSARASGHAIPNGSFTIETRWSTPLPKLIQRINPILVAPGYEIDAGWTAQNRQSATQAAGGTPPSTLVLGLRQIPLIGGRVLSPTGQPLPGASITAMPIWTGMRNLENEKTETSSGEDGGFTLSARSGASSTLGGFYGLYGGGYGMGMGMGMGMMGGQPSGGGAQESIVTVRHPLYATCIYSASGLVPGTVADLGDLSVLPARRVQMKITYENLEQKQYWQAYSKERYEVPMFQQGQHVWNQEANLEADRLSGDTLFPVGPFTSVYLTLNHPMASAFFTAWQFGSRGQQPWEWKGREELPETVELTAPALPIRRFRVIDQNGEPVRNAQYKIALLYKQGSFWASLLPKKIRPSRYRPVETHNNLRTSYDGEVESIIPENVPMVVTVVPISQGPPPAPMGAKGRIDVLPKESFVLGSVEEIGDLILSATVAPGVWNAVPK